MPMSQDRNENQQQATEYLTLQVRAFTDKNAYYYSVNPDPNSNDTTVSDIADRLISKYKEAWDRLAE